MQSTITTELPDGTRAMGWLHRTHSSTLIVVIHGHNSFGDRSRFITMAKWFEHGERSGVRVHEGSPSLHHKLDCVRWNAVRPVLGEQVYGVLTLAQEYEQVKALVEKLRPNYTRVIAVGHSQGGLHALRLCDEGLAHAFVSLMGVVDTKRSLETKLASMGLTLDGMEHVEGEVRVTLPNGIVFDYTEEFFTDFLQWNAKKLLDRWHGPSLFVKATRDTAILPVEVDEGFACAHEPKRLITVDDEHNFSDETAMQLAHDIKDWLAQVDSTAS